MKNLKDTYNYVYHEKQELEARILRLRNYLISDDFISLKDDQQQLLTSQMKSYQQLKAILDKRLESF